nr:hypothetical protein [Pandoravirus aubagnensis]
MAERAVFVSFFLIYIFIFSNQLICCDSFFFQKKHTHKWGEKRCSRPLLLWCPLCAVPSFFLVFVFHQRPSGCCCCRDHGIMIGWRCLSLSLSLFFSAVAWRVRPLCTTRIGHSNRALCFSLIALFFCWSRHAFPFLYIALSRVLLSLSSFFAVTRFYFCRLCQGSVG